MIDVNIRGQLMPHIWVQFTPNRLGWIRSYECIVWDLDTGKEMPYVCALELKVERGRFTAVVSYSVDEDGNPCEVQRPKPFRIMTTECVVGAVAVTPPPADTEAESDLDKEKA